MTDSTSKGRPIGSGGQAPEITKNDIQRLSESLRGQFEHRDRSMLWFGLGCGLRIAEISSLRLRDILDLDGNILKTVTIDRHNAKSGRARTLPLHPQTSFYLKRYLETAKLDLLNQYSPLFPSKKGGFISANSMAKRAKLWLRRAGIAGSSHSMRRTYAVELRRQGVDLGILQTLLGHSSVGTTARYFGVCKWELSAAVGALRF